MCYHNINVITCYTKKYSKQTSAMVSGSCMEPLRQMLTTGLSQWNDIFCLAHWWPKVLSALTIPSTRSAWLSGLVTNNLESVDHTKRHPSLLTLGHHYRCELVVHWVSRIKEDPSQLDRKSCHHSMSSWASQDMWMWWWRCLVVMLRSRRQHKKMWPAAITLQANENFPMRESSRCFVHFLRCMKDYSSSKIDDLCLSDILAVMALVSITTPKKFIWVQGGNNFSAYIGRGRA